MPPPRADELLSGYIARTAYWNGVSAWKFVDIHWSRRPFWQRDLDRTVSSGWIGAFAALTGHPRSTVEAMTLHRARVILSGARSGITPTFLAVGVHHTKRRLHGLQFCPDCLSEQPAVYRRTWRSGLLLHCPLHRRRMLDACPHCDAPLAPHRSRILLWDLCAHCERYLPLDGDASTLSDDVSGHDGPLPDHAPLVTALLAGDRGAADVAHDIRALVGLLHLGRTEAKLRALFGMRPARDVRREGRFELARWAPRREMLGVVAQWMEDWPDAFHAGAADAGLSQVSFAWQAMGPRLAREVALLPERRMAARRSPEPRIHDAEMRRLRRHDRALYRRRRAARLDRLTR